MARKEARVICRGFFEKPLPDIGCLEEIMDRLERDETLRPELEVIPPRRGSSLPVLAALAFSSSDASIKGWLISHSAGDDRDSVGYCATHSQESAIHTEVILCGAPHMVLTSALLSKAEAVQVLGSIIEGTEASGFEMRPLSFVFGLEE